MLFAHSTGWFFGFVVGFTICPCFAQNQWQQDSGQSYAFIKSAGDHSDSATVIPHVAVGDSVSEAGYFHANTAPGISTRNGIGVANPRFQWFSNVEATFLRPGLDRPNASVFVTEPGKTIVGKTAAGEITSFYAAPRVSIGATCDQKGIVFRHWQLEFGEDEYVDTPDFQNAGVPTVIGLTYDNFDLDMYAMDLEWVRPFRLRSIDGQMTLGTRYVELESAAYAHTSDFLNGNDLATISNFELIHYNGLGLTGGLSGSRSIRNGWSLYWGGRASGIFGSLYQKKAVTGAFQGSYARAEVVIDNSSASSTTQAIGTGSARAAATAAPENQLWIFEGQLGLRYSRQLACIPATASLGFGFEYQYWDLPDTYVDTALEVGSLNLSGPAPVRSTSINLIGFSVGAGLSY